MTLARLQGLHVDKDSGELIKLKSKRGRLVPDLSNQDARSSARSNRYVLQNHSASSLRGERVSKCCRVNIDSSVHVLRSSFESGNAAHYKGLMFCGSVWVCPVCGAKISERRSHELREAFDAAKKQKINVSHITFTFPHAKTDNLQTILNQFLEAFKKFWDSAPMRRFKDEYGCIGRVRALETTYSDANGFHPHIHLLYFTKVKLSDVTDIQNQFLEVWNDKLKRVGLPPANSRGISIQNGDKAGEYINKFADDSKLEKVTTKTGDAVTWDMADEITKLNSKSGRKKSLTPFDFLRLIDDPESYGYDKKDIPRFRALFREYAKAFKGKSQLEWGRMSMDLRKNLGLKSAATDEEILNEDVAEAKKFISLPRSVFSRLVPKKSNNYRDLRSTFLTICESKSQTEAQQFLHTACFPELSKSDFSKLMRTAFEAAPDDSVLQTRDCYKNTQWLAYQNRLMHMQYE
ncbi:protein rep [Vibrio parahaemolyticus]|nr:protein rep [Vibrio parahaemolyticus]ELM4340977.1 protein rep [Vibrio parahaemolyticus]